MSVASWKRSAIFVATRRRSGRRGGVACRLPWRRRRRGMTRVGPGAALSLRPGRERQRVETLHVGGHSVRPGLAHPGGEAGCRLRGEPVDDPAAEAGWLAGYLLASTARGASRAALRPSSVGPGVPARARPPSPRPCFPDGEARGTRRPSSWRTRRRQAAEAGGLPATTLASTAQGDGSHRTGLRSALVGWAVVPPREGMRAGEAFAVSAGAAGSSRRQRRGSGSAVFVANLSAIRRPRRGGLPAPWLGAGVTRWRCAQPSSGPRAPARRNPSCRRCRVRRGGRGPVCPAGGVGR